MTAALGTYIWWIVSGVFLAGLLFWKFTYKFYWFDFWYGFPLIGGMSRLKDATPDSQDKTWTRAEKKLCNDFEQFILEGDKDAFENRAEYIRKAGDLGVKPMPVWLWVFLWLLIIAEGFGFAYSLGTWMAMEGSENIFMILMVVVALVIAVPSALLSHESGVRFHRHMERKRNYQDWKVGRSNNEDKFKTETIALQKSQSVDDNLFPFNQYANRAHIKISLLPLWGALAWAIVVVVGSTTMRISHMEKVLAQENTGVVAAQAVADSGNPFAAPAELAQPQAAAQDKAVNDIKTSTKIEGSAAFILLAFLYLATQGVGASLAAKHAFLGAQSEAAYNGNFGFETYDDFLRYYEPMVQIAQARLQTLQERLGNSPENNQGMQLHHTFDEHLEAQRKRRINQKVQNTISLPAVNYAPPQPPVITESKNAPQIQTQPNEPISIQATVSPENSSQPKSKFCSTCGSPITSNARFCSGCGSSFA